jgi:serine/threonine-protein kinase
MGRVYKVRNVITDRVEAMKVLLPDLQGHEDVVARFLREIKVLAALKHPNIAALLTALTIENQLVMIMEYVEGQALSSRVSQGPLPVGDALNYVDQVLDALSYAHRQHVIHRDIKPANMMLTPDRKVKLMDFGIARSGTETKKLTTTGSTLGSLSYMSPEQVKGEPVDERSDLYSVGISLYEMVTGQKPFHGDSDYSIMAAQINESATPPLELQPGLPKLVNDIILQAISKPPEHRFQSAEAFRNAVKEARRIMQNEITAVRGSDEVPAMGANTLQSSADAATTVRGSQEATVAAAAARTVAAAAASPAATAMKQTPAAEPTPAAPQMPVPPPPATHGHRGLYMALGALVVVLALIAAGLYIPGHRKASADVANSTSQPQAVNTTTTATGLQPQQSGANNPSSNSATQPNPDPNVNGEALGNALANTITKEVNNTVNNALSKANSETEKALNKALTNGGGAGTQHKNLAGQNSGGANGTSGSPNSQTAADTAQLDALEHEIDQLTGRVAAVNSSLEAMQRQQQAEGYGLRGDMASKQASMKVNLAKAQDAIEHNDAARAKRYIDLTTADVEALEKFLGR